MTRGKIQRSLFTLTERMQIEVYLEFWLGDWPRINDLSLCVRTYMTTNVTVQFEVKERERECLKKERGKYFDVRMKDIEVNLRLSKIFCMGCTYYSFSQFIFSSEENKNTICYPELELRTKQKCVSHN